jgi:hypothetical protein
MSGTIIPLFSRRNFTQTAGITTPEIILVKAVDVSKYTQGVLIVRAHTWTAGGAAPTISVIARNTAPSMEDSARDFVITASAVATGSVTGLTITDKLVMTTLTANFAGMLQISVQVATPGAATINADLSAELVMRE